MSRQDTLLAELLLIDLWDQDLMDDYGDGPLGLEARRLRKQEIIEDIACPSSKKGSPSGSN